MHQRAKIGHHNAKWNLWIFSHFYLDLFSSHAASKYLLLSESGANSSVIKTFSRKKIISEWRENTNYHEQVEFQLAGKMCPLLWWLFWSVPMFFYLFRLEATWLWALKQQHPESLFYVAHWAQTQKNVRNRHNELHKSKQKKGSLFIQYEI